MNHIIKDNRCEKCGDYFPSDSEGVTRYDNSNKGKYMYFYDNKSIALNHHDKKTCIPCAIKALLHRKKWKVSELAERLSEDEKTVNKWMDGKTKPTINLIKLLHGLL